MDETAIDFATILGVLQRRMRLIAITLALALSIALSMTFVLTPKYTASALIRVDTASKDLLDPINMTTSMNADSARVDSEVEILKTDSVMLSVMESMQLMSDPEFGGHTGHDKQLHEILRLKGKPDPSDTAAQNKIIAKLKSAMQVRRVGLTNLISVALTATDPDRAAEIANAIASAYIADQVQAKIATTLTARDILQNRIMAARQSIVVAEEAFDDFITQKVDAISHQTGRTDIVLVRDELQRSLAHREQVTASATEVSENLSLGNWSPIAQSLNDQALAELVRQRQSLAGYIQVAAADSVSVFELETALTEMDTQLHSRAEAGLSSLRKAVAAQQAQISSLRSQLRATVLGGEIPPEALSQIYGLQQNAEVARTQYQTLITRVRDLDAQAQIQVADSRIVSPALPPSGASFPNTRLILSLAGLAGLGLGVGLAFLYENVLGGFSTEAQVEAVLRLPTAIAVPLPRTVPVHHMRSPADLMHLAPMSFYAESIRRLRANLDQSMGIPTPRQADNSQKAPAKVIMVASAVPGEGKSTVALSLGRAYAAAGHKALVIDCDLRNPSLHRLLGLEGGVGLFEYLRAGANPTALEDVVIADPQSNMAAVIGGRSSDTPTDQLVSGTTLGRLISHARAVFDFVILDSPPLLPIVDGMYLARHADAVALVIKWSTTSQSDSRGALNILRSAMQSDVEVVAVLNQQVRRRGAYNPHDLADHTTDMARPQT